MLHEIICIGGLSVSADIINFNQYRKSRDKADKQVKAVENRTRFGRSKSEKLAYSKLRDVSEKNLSGKKITDDDPEDDRETPV
jgi:hypothetical protein